MRSHETIGYKPAITEKSGGDKNLRRICTNCLF